LSTWIDVKVVVGARTIRLIPEIPRDMDWWTIDSSDSAANDVLLLQRHERRVVQDLARVVEAPHRRNGGIAVLRVRGVTLAVDAVACSHTRLASTLARDVLQGISAALPRTTN